MARVHRNWERLVRATLKREQLRVAKGHQRAPSGIAGAVPPSLGRSTNIDTILQAADEIQLEDPNVARILCEQAYSMAQNLDPSSDGRGVLQFKTGLMSIIKQKLAKKDGGRIDRNRDIEHLWEFYQRYKRQHRVDDIQREEEKWRESGTFTTNMGDLEHRSREMKKVFSTLRALVEVMEELSKEADPNGVGRLILEELRRIKKADATISAELTPYNIVPLEAPVLTNAIGFFPEVRAAISAIRYTEHFPRPGAAFKSTGQRELDMFDLLEYVFGFQKDNARNQRENVILTIANAQSRFAIPVENEPKIDERAIHEVFMKVLDNYIKWCKYLRKRPVWSSAEALTRDRKLFLVSLYFLIWGEAANVRFLPECICYIFHHICWVVINGQVSAWVTIVPQPMAKELDAIIDHGEATRASCCVTENGASFLEKIICPIYGTLSASWKDLVGFGGMPLILSGCIACLTFCTSSGSSFCSLDEAENNNNGKAAHSSWRNYDDFNEYFWSPTCFEELSWPMKIDSPFLMKPKGRKRTGKSSFVEHRTFLHLYRSFHRLWMFLILMFQALTIIAFQHGRFNMDTLKKLLSIGPAFGIMNFFESCLDVLLMFGAYTSARGMAISRLVIRFLWCGLSSAAVTYLYIKVMEENNKQTSDSIYFRIYILVLGVYAAIRLVFALFLKIPACHSLSAMSDQSFFQFFKWIYQERYFVGRGLYEGIGDFCRRKFGVSSFEDQNFCDPALKWQPFNDLTDIRNMLVYVYPRKALRYVLFWLLIFACKFVFAYFLQIKPLVNPTKIVVGLQNLTYSWHDLVSKHNHNMLTIASLWAPVVAQIRSRLMDKAAVFQGYLKKLSCFKVEIKRIYLMDIYIWYTLLAAVIGGVRGARDRLGEIRSIEMLHKRFESFPEAFVKNLVSSPEKRVPFNQQEPQAAQDRNKAYAAMFSPFWNEIIKSLREEDYISNREMDLLSMPRNTGSLRLVQWPLFLLSSKILLAIDLALDCKDTQEDLWSRICRDEYMAYAVQECYYSVEKILHSLVDAEGRLWVERIFREIHHSIVEHSLVITLNLKNLPLVLKKFTALTGLLIRNDPQLARGAARAVYELYEAVTHDLLSSDLREQLDTWDILARARNAGRLFSRIEWPKDPEIKEQVKRLHLLLTVKDSAANIPKNLEARRRLQFFTNSLFMAMPHAKPVAEMMPFCVFTPYYSETVLYSPSELRVENEDGISILFYLQKIYPDEWENFLERIGRGELTGDVELQQSASDTLELRFWASYRGQTLSRTVRGMMYYRRALMLQSYLERRPLGAMGAYPETNFPTSQGFELSREARAQADLKFTYVVSCQIYGQQKQLKKPEATDIALLLQRNEALRVAFIHTEEIGAADGKVTKEFYSKLVKADIHGKDQCLFFSLVHVQSGNKLRHFGSTCFSISSQAFSGLDEGISKQAKLLGNTALNAVLNAQFLVQIGVFTAVPMIMGFILELGLLQFMLIIICGVLEVTLLLIVYIGYGTVEDFDDWTSWLLYKGGVGVKGDDSWESWWDEEQTHIQTLRGRILETILSLRFFIFQYGIVYKLNLVGRNTSLAVYGFSWIVMVVIVFIFKIFTYSPKKNTNIQLFLRFIQGVTSLGLITAICLAVAFTRLSIVDLFVSALAFIATGWAVLCLAITWKKFVRYLGLWESVREFARMYDAGMGVVIFSPIAFLSWFPFVSTFQSRLLFNQAFSRGLEISLILAGNKANVDVY
ncbi:hypothetical protein ACFE04_029027 [Oxalis oulophora]